MSGNSFRFQTNSTDDQRSINTFPISSNGDVKEAAVAHRADRDVHESVKEDLEGAEVDNAMNIQVEAENVVEAFEGTTVGKVFRNAQCPRCQLGIALNRARSDLSQIVGFVV